MDMDTLRRHAAHLSDVWEFYISHESLPANRQWGRWLQWNPPERIEEAIKSLAKRLQRPPAMTGGNDGLHAYVTGALKNMRTKEGEQPRAWESPPSSTLDTVPPDPDTEPVIVERPKPVGYSKLDWDQARKDAEEYQRQRDSLKEPQ